MYIFSWWYDSKEKPLLLGGDTWCAFSIVTDVQMNTLIDPKSKFYIKYCCFCNTEMEDMFLYFTCCTCCTVVGFTGMATNQWKLAFTCAKNVNVHCPFSKLKKLKSKLNFVYLWHLFRWHWKKGSTVLKMLPSNNNTWMSKHFKNS